MLAALTRVLDDRSFKQAAERVSRRMRSHTRSGVQQAADFIEHVVDTGGEPYLATPELPFYALYNLDVVLALAAACAALHFGVSMPLLRMVMAALRKMRGSAAVVLADGQNAMPPIASKSKRA